MKTFALFDDGTARQIVIGFLEPEDLPLVLIPLNIPDNQVIHSAQNGFYAAYQVLKGIGYIRGERYCLSYQFKGEGMTFYAQGESAGLGFCLKFAQQIYQRETGKQLNYSIAATGVITDGTERAEVKWIGGIGAKLQGALTCLNKGDKIFYPYENEEEIGSELKKDAVRRGIELIPVSTVEHAIKRLLEKFPVEEYPIEIEGLMKSVSDQGAYQLTRRLYLGRKISVPFKVVNKGNLGVEIEAKGQESVADWLKLSLLTTPLAGQGVQEARIDIPPCHRLLFFLRHCFKFFFQRKGQLSLCFHIPEAEPYDLTRNIQVRVRFFNLWLMIALLVLPPSPWYLDYGHQLYKMVWEGRNRIVSLITEPSIPKPNELIQQVMRDLEQGQHLEAKGQMDRFLKHSSTQDERIMSLYYQISDRLNLKINFHYLSRERETQGPEGSTTASSLGGAVLRSGDGYQFEYTPDDNCFLYVYLLDPRQNLLQLFPDLETSPEQNPLEASKSYWLPAGGNWFILDQHTGQETIYFVASRWPARDLENLFAQFSNASRQEEKDEYRNRLLQRLKAREEARAAGLEGCFYKEYSFRHE